LKITEQPICAYLKLAKSANMTITTIFVMFQTVENKLQKVHTKKLQAETFAPSNKVEK
jgi:hypothetical protein